MQVVLQSDLTLILDYSNKEELSDIQIKRIHIQQLEAKPIKNRELIA